MDQIGAKAIDDWIRWLKLRADQGSRCRRSFREELRLLSTVFGWYRENHDHTFQTPILRRHRPMVDLPEKTKRRADYYMRPEEAWSWLECLKNRRDPIYYRLGLTMLLTGIRMGEASGLCWDSVSLNASSRSTITIRRTLSWSHRTKEPYLVQSVKSASSERTLPIPDEVGEVLLQMRENKLRSPLWKDLVFVNSKGNALQDNTIRGNFNAAFREANLSWSGSHVLRHSFATIGLQAEGDMARIQAVMGHSSPSQTAAYAKVIALQRSTVSDKVSQSIRSSQESGRQPQLPGENPGGVVLVAQQC